MVRKANIEDVPVIVALLKRIERRLDTGWPNVGKHRLHAPSVTRSLSTFLNGDNGACFLTDHAVMVAEVQPCFYNYSVRYATEILFQSDGVDGDKVLRAMSDWAWNAGCAYLLTSVFLNYSPEDDIRRARFMKRKGFTAHQLLWRKRFI